MNISAETHILVGDIAFSMAVQCDEAWKQKRDIPNNLAAGWLQSLGFREYLIGINMGLDAFEEEYYCPPRTCPT